CVVHGRAVRGGTRRLARRESVTVSNVLLGRIAADRFGVILSGSFDTAGVAGLVDDALNRLAEPVYLDEIGVGVGASAGIIVRSARATESGQLIEGAGLALHRAKRSGKAQWALYDPVADADNQQWYRLGAGIAGGLETGEFSVGYRPLVALPHGNRAVGARFELRWNHPEHGVLPAERFVELADT